MISSSRSKAPRRHRHRQCRSPATELSRGARHGCSDLGELMGDGPGAGSRALALLPQGRGARRAEPERPRRSRSLRTPTLLSAQRSRFVIVGTDAPAAARYMAPGVRRRTAELRQAALVPFANDRALRRSAARMQRPRQARWATALVTATRRSRSSRRRLRRRRDAPRSRWLIARRVISRQCSSRGRRMSVC